MRSGARSAPVITRPRSSSTAGQGPTLTRGSINSGAVAMPVNGSTARRPGWSPNGSTTTSAERRTWTSVWSARCYNRQRHETEQELAELLAGEPGADVEAAVNAVLLANDQPARPHTAGSISTPEDQGCRCPPTSTGRPCPDRFQVLIELARRRRERLQGRPHVGYDPLFNGAVVQPGAKRDGADGITLGELIEQFSADRTARLSPGRSPNTTLCCGSYVMRGTSTYPSARSPASTAVRSGTLLRSCRRR
jgi:hypothetical protein